MAEFVELTIEQGATFISTITIKDSEDIPLDLTNFTVKAQMRKSYYSSTAINFQVEIVSAINGLVTINLDAISTSSIKPGRYVYDVRIKDQFGDAIRIFEGIATVTPGVTRD